VKIGAQFVYDEAVKRVEELNRQIATDRGLPKRSDVIARLLQEERQIKTHCSGIDGRIDKLTTRWNAVCCSVLRCAAVCCYVVQCVAVCCSVLQCVAVSCAL